MSEDLKARIRRLEDREEIKELKARYFRLMDTKRFDELVLVFTADATAQWDDAPGVAQPEGERRAVGAEAIVARIMSTVRPRVTIHHGHLAEIEFVGLDEARGIWAMEDIIERPGAAVPSFHGFGHYWERYLRVDGEWRIADLRLTRLSVHKAPSWRP